MQALFDFREHPLHPNPCDGRLVDGAGKHYLPSKAGLHALEAERGEQTPLTAPLRPGQAYTTILV